MNSLGTWLFVAIMCPAALVLFVLLFGLARVIAVRHLRKEENEASPMVPLEMVIPVKGEFPGQEAILGSLLEQDYHGYGVIFVVEDEEDPANAMVDKLCAKWPEVRKVIGGVSNGCAQKNHSLIKGMEALRPETEIVMFCDSSNWAPRDWLRVFTAKVRSGKADVTTTFRIFTPDPENLSGVCQAVYASCILPLNITKTKPWGGATAIRRKVLDSLDVVPIWSRTVVDDLVLGNLLDDAGVRVVLDPANVLHTPLRGQSFSGLMAYLDRQILFPKFTNPGVWLATLVGAVTVTAATIVAAVTAVLYALGFVEGLPAWISLGYLAAGVLLATLLRKAYRAPISWRMWMVALFPTVFLVCYLFVRSIFTGYIDWHGRRYYTGRGGVVLSCQSLSGAEKTG